VWVRCMDNRSDAASVSITVVVTASPAPLFHPSTAMIHETLLSLVHLQLPRLTPVLLSHDGPKSALKGGLSDAQATALSFGSSSTWPRSYIDYLMKVRDWLVPSISSCLGFSVRLLVRATQGTLAGNLEFALSFVRTSYVLKVEHDHCFMWPIDVQSIVRDMHSDLRIKLVRFNRRENVRVGFDDGFASQAWSSQERQLDTQAARALWGSHTTGGVLENNYTRVGAFSDVNHLTSARYYRKVVLPVCTNTKTAYPYLTCEVMMNQFGNISRNHAKYGLYIYGGLNAPPSVAHLDASQHGGEKTPAVHQWIAKALAQARVNATRVNATGGEPPACRPPRDLRPPPGFVVHKKLRRSRDGEP